MKEIGVELTICGVNSKLGDTVTRIRPKNRAKFQPAPKHGDAT